MMSLSMFLDMSGACFVVACRTVVAHCVVLVKILMAKMYDSTFTQFFLILFGQLLFIPNYWEKLLPVCLRLYKPKL